LTKFFVGQETSTVFFLAEEELVRPVTAAIHSAGRVDQHGTGVVFVLPLEQVAGIKDKIVRPAAELTLRDLSGDRDGAG
jgi:nitrogen regulatory protein PII